MLPRARKFDPALHTSIGSVLTGFAALILSLHGANCSPPDLQRPTPSYESSSQLP